MTMEILEIVKEAVNSLGFPVAMVVYFIWDKQKTMEPVLESINNMNTLLAVLCEKLDLKEVVRNE